MGLHHDVERAKAAVAEQPSEEAYLFEGNPYTFTPGMRVRHEKRGPGTVLQRAKKESRLVLKFDSGDIHKCHAHSLSKITPLDVPAPAPSAAEPEPSGLPKSQPVIVAKHQMFLMLQVAHATQVPALPSPSDKYYFELSFGRKEQKSASMRDSSQLECTFIMDATAALAKSKHLEVPVALWIKRATGRNHNCGTATVTLTAQMLSASHNQVYHSWVNLGHGADLLPAGEEGEADMATPPEPSLLVRCVLMSMEWLVEDHVAQQRLQGARVAAQWKLGQKAVALKKVRERLLEETKKREQAENALPEMQAALASLGAAVSGLRAEDADPAHRAARRRVGPTALQDGRTHALPRRQGAVFNSIELGVQVLRAPGRRAAPLHRGRR